MFNPTKEKVFKNPAYRELTTELINQYYRKVKLIAPCPDCKAVVGLNGFGFLVDAAEKPEAMVYGCRECLNYYISPVFV